MIFHKKIFGLRFNSEYMQHAVIANALNMGFQVGVTCNSFVA